MEAYIILTNSDDRIDTINTGSIEKFSIKSAGQVMQCTITLHLEQITFTSDSITAKHIEHAVCVGLMSSHSNKKYEVKFN